MMIYIKKVLYRDRKMEMSFIGRAPPAAARRGARLRTLLGVFIINEQN